MQFCTKCGAQIPENVSFCPKCGNNQQGGQLKQALSSKNKPTHKNIFVLVGIGLGVVIVLFLLFLLFFVDTDVDSVKNSNFLKCPKYTVEEVVNSFMGNPEWESFIEPDSDEDVDYYVNIKGDIAYNGSPAVGMLQLWVKGDDIGIQGFEINGQLQNEDMENILLSNMCKSAQKAKSSAKKEKSSSSKDSRVKNKGLMLAILALAVVGKIARYVYSRVRRIRARDKETDETEKK